MKKLTLFLIMFAMTLCFASAIRADAQSRKSVSATEVNGTYRSQFTGKFKGTYSEIKIFSIGKGRLKVSFELIYPYIIGNGELSANMGEAIGFATIVGDKAVYSSDEYGRCRITIKFVKPGFINVTQEGSDAECGFGRNVSAGGTYKKSSGAKPKF